MIRSNGLSCFLWLAAIVAWGLLAHPALSQGPDPASRRLVRIAYQSRETLAALDRQGWDIWEVHEGYAIAAVPASLLSGVNLAGVSLEDLGPVRPLNSFDPTYHTYTEMLAEIQAVAAAHPDIIRLYDIGNGWEKTVGRANRDLWAVQITRFPTDTGYQRMGPDVPTDTGYQRMGSDVPTDTGHQRMGSQDSSAGVYRPLETTRPSVLFVANHHAREIATTEVALQLLSLLINGYGQDAEITYLMDNLETWIVPMANPDGHARAEVGLDWRKNADDAQNTCPGGWPPYSFGIDLNRNFGYQWGGASPYPCDITYQGPEAFSEPENQALRDLMITRTFALALSYHSYGRYVLYPWGYTGAEPLNASLMSTISSKMASYNGYTAGQASTTLYSLTGDLCDWAYGVRNIPCLVVEMGNQFDPPASALPGLWAENRPGALYLLKIADDPTRAYGPEATAASVVSWTGGLTLTANLSDVFNGGQAISTTEYFVDTLGANGSGTPMLPVDGAWNSPQEVAVAALPALSPGRHILFVRGQDVGGHWGTMAATFWDVPWRVYLPLVTRD